MSKSAKARQFAAPPIDEWWTEDGRHVRVFRGLGLRSYPIRRRMALPLCLLRGHAWETPGLWGYWCSRCAAFKNGPVQP